MKATTQRKRKTVEAPPINNIAILGRDSVKKSTNRTNGRRESKTGGYNNTLQGEVPGVLPFTAVQEVGQQLPRADTLSQKTKEAHELEPIIVGLRPTKKIKLQLFPIDEGTRIGLEKDGHNPFLELTLRARKKILSVLKHLNDKWGSSNVALGDLLLFPYNIQLEKLSTYKRWSIKDNCISAGDVYADMGSPSLFRLRYGWLSNLESRTFKLPSRTTLLGPSFENEGPQKSCDRIAKMDDINRKVGDTSNTGRVAHASLAGIMSAEAAVGHVDDEYNNRSLPHEWVSRNDDSLTNLSIGWLLSDASLLDKISNCNSKSKGMKSNLQPIQLISSDLSIGGLLSEASMQGRILDNEAKLNGTKPDLQLTRDNGIVPSWDDSFTTLSIGNLLSEALLQSKIDTGNKPGLHPTLSISDSFDAFLSDRISSQTQASKPSAHISHSSILDAEETCHAFPFGKSSLFAKNSGSLRGSAVSNRNNDFELNSEGALAKDRQESETGLLTHHNESSLGLACIKWTESLGPFDISFPAT